MVLALMLLFSCIVARAEGDSGLISSKYICNLAEAVSAGNWHDNPEIGAILTIFVFLEYTNETGVDAEDLYDGGDVYVCSSDSCVMEIYLWKSNGHCLCLSVLDEEASMIFYYDFGEYTRSTMETVMDTCYYKLSASDLVDAIDTISEKVQ